MVRAVSCGPFLLALGVVVLLMPAQAQNLDEGKSGARLFADSCVTCHHSAKGLTNGRFRLSLYLFLQQHYASNSSAAWELASYLESVDEGGRPRRAAAKKPSRGTGLAGGSLRPPAPIPQR
jgi:mono/diheme cytochrome c family protein